MKTKNDILAIIAQKEAREEMRDLRSSLRERIDGIKTTDKEKLEKQFGVKLFFESWGCSPAELRKTAKEAIVTAVKGQMLVRRAKRKAAEIGLSYWPALLLSYYGKNNLDPLAYVAAERVLLSRGVKPWGTMLEKQPKPRTAWDGTSVKPAKDKVSHGGWDSQGHWGISPTDVARCWFAAGCKDNRKFRFLVRNAYATSTEKTSLVGFKVKTLSLRQLRDLSRGQRWVNTHFRYDSRFFSTKAIIALGRISPAARKAATSGLLVKGVMKNDGWGEYSTDVLNEARKVRIRDLNWSAVKALQTMLKEEITARYLAGRYAWKFLTGAEAPVGLEKVLPPIDREKLPEELKVRTVTFKTFSLVAPTGYAFGADENGTKIFEAANPEEDYHFEESEALSVKRGAEGLVQKLRDNADVRRQRRESDREFAMIMDNLHLIMVSRFDSYRAGNCAAGTASFANRNGIDQRGLVRADRLFHLAKDGYSSERVMNTIRCAWERETLVMI